MCLLRVDGPAEPELTRSPIRGLAHPFQSLVSALTGLPHPCALCKGGRANLSTRHSISRPPTPLTPNRRPWPCGGWPTFRQQIAGATTDEVAPPLRLRSGQALADFARVGIRKVGNQGALRCCGCRRCLPWVAPPNPFTLERAPSKLYLGGGFPRLSDPHGGEDASLLSAPHRPPRFDFHGTRLPRRVDRSLMG